ncbi:phosphatidylinositol 4-kinase, putative [Entamoeba invadens IP1]|uniref:1-phosphatidylinositol 4-kinase n=1 Tax=Entamoeba invadens IP1 TaxID=370355 RepID=A0A0A1U2D5_ENTIV|nr:phosphatidylinositol 4-kinase, putative [Entamoeba invadens IP1]ELP88194.1 phosphatidylinositol 4-kinase, putative [Entamoeba invadens IP1]|eukprot:XP_004254965.1 phosphatidylinositol 4-kinase, putative [Entamoeba invadens IP1]
MSLTLKQKYIKLLLKSDVNTHLSRLQPFFDVLNINTTKDGINSQVVLDTLVPLQEFYNEIGPEHPLYSTLTGTLLKYIKMIDNIPLSNKHLLFLKTMIGHPMGASIHEDVFLMITSVLTKGSENDVKILLLAMASQSFVSFSKEQRTDLIALIHDKHGAKEKIVRPALGLVADDLEPTQVTLNHESTISEKLEYYIKLAQFDEKKYFNGLESTLQDVLQLDYCRVNHFYPQIFHALAIVAKHDVRTLDDFRKHCTFGSIPDEKMKDVVTRFATYFDDETLTRFIETSRSHISLQYSPSGCAPNAFLSMVLFVAQLCAIKKEKKTNVDVLSYLINLVNYPLTEKDFAILNSLPIFTSLNEEELYKISVNYIITFFKLADTDILKAKRNVPEDLSKVVNAVCSLLTKIVGTLTDNKLRFDLLKKTIGIFIKLSNSTTPEASLNIKNRTEVQLMGKLLEPISLLIEGMEDMITEEADLKLFRTFWFTCVVVKYVKEGEHPSEWYTCVKDIAFNIPPLLMKKSHVEIEVEGEILAILTRFYNIEQHKLLYEDFLKTTELGISTRGSQPNRILMFVSIYYLELFRGERFGFGYISEYLDDSIGEEPMYNFVIPVYGILFKKILNVVKQLLSSEKLSVYVRNKAMTRLVSFLIVKTTTSNDNTFNFISSALKEIVDTIPYVVYNKNVLFLLLQIVDTISKMNTSNPLDVKRIRIAQTDFFIETPEDSSSGQKVAKNVKDFATLYIQSGFKLQPRLFSHLVQAYILQLPMSSYNSSKGVELALSIGNQYVDMSMVVSDISQKASFLGFAKMHNQSVETQQAALLKAIKETTGNKNVLLKEAVSFIVLNCTNVSECADLLQAIVMIPMEKFDSESVDSAVSNWEWLMCVCTKEIGNYILRLISLAWNKTIIKKIGLFNAMYVTSNPLSSSVGNTEQMTHASSVVPHRNIIKFLDALLPIVEVFKDGLRLSIIHQIVQESLKAKMTPEPSSVGTRFMLLLLGLKVIQLSQKEKIHYMGMIQDIENVGLEWFESKPEWFECCRMQAEHDVNTLVSFNTVLIALLSQSRDRKYNITEDQVEDMKQKAMLLIPFVGNEVERIAVWNNPLNIISKQFPNQRLYIDSSIPKEYRRRPKDLVLLAWYYAPNLVVGYYNRFTTSANFKLVTQQILAEPTKLLNNPQAHVFIATPEHIEQNIPQLNQLLYWESTDPPHALNLLKKDFKANPFVTLYALRVLDTFDEHTVLYYVPQLVQSLRYDNLGIVEPFIIRMGKKYQLIAHQLIWNCDTYSTESTTMTVKQDPTFVAKLKEISKKIVENYDEKEMSLFKAERGFFEKFTTISAGLIPIENRDQRLAQLKEKLGELQVDRSDLYVPTNPNAMVSSVSNQGCACLRSAAKVPILVNMRVKERYTGVESPLPIIFKAGDDIRSDMLAVQLIELFDRINKHSGLNIYLCPYRIIATGPDCGIIEVVQNSMSRDQIGEKCEGDMYTYFLAKYGGRKTEAFYSARANFIRSMSAYSIVSYILQIKDRHNGNILIDDEGHLIHIDFGFMFDRSPGGDLGIEKSPFKLTEEMISIMGGSPIAEQFIWFMEQAVKSFLALRDYYQSIVTLVELMLDTKMNVFKPNSLQNLIKRFNPDSNVTQAAGYMSGVVKEAFSLKGTFFTYFYDKFQALDNGISM